MSWSVSFLGKPEAVAAALERESEKHTGQSKVEYDDAKPHLVALVRQNFADPAGPYQTPLIKFEACGSGCVQNGQQVQRSCTVKIEPLYANLVT